MAFRFYSTLNNCPTRTICGSGCRTCVVGMKTIDIAIPGTGGCSMTSHSYVWEHEPCGNCIACRVRGDKYDRFQQDKFHHYGCSKQPYQNHHPESWYRTWARSNYKAFTPIDGAWYPIVQDECVKINMEATRIVHRTSKVSISATSSKPYEDEPSAPYPCKTCIYRGVYGFDIIPGVGCNNPDHPPCKCVVCSKEDRGIW